MWFANATKTSDDGGAQAIRDLVRQIGLLMRHPAYRRGNIMSPMLRRHLPSDPGYAWQGEEVLRERLVRAKLDSATLDYLRVGVQAELETLRKPAVR